MSSDPSPGLYIHVPFCRSKCAYCAFASTPDLSRAGEWLNAVCREMALHEGLFPPFDTLYVGGGTPSVLEDNAIASLLDEAFRRFSFRPDPEITLEVNPDDVSMTRLSFLRGLGINRLSIGAQSFDDEDLVLLGRRHTAAQTRHVLHAAREAGFESVSIDLIMAIPGRRADPLGRWMATLEEASAFNPEHLSCYLLTYEKGARLQTLLRRAGIPPLDEATERELFLKTSGYLQARGYRHYEVSNFARTEAHRSRHNSKYWRHVPYMGLGPSAHSFLEGSRWWNVRSVKRYCEHLASRRPPTAGRETLTPDQIHLERLALGLRTCDGVPGDLLPRGKDREKTLSRLRLEGLIRLEGSRICPTPEGYLVSDSLPLLFLP